MEEESDSRKINNSFLRDHNYATEGIWKIELNSILTYINDGDGRWGRGASLQDSPVYECVAWTLGALVLFGALMILVLDLKVLQCAEPRMLLLF